jgi:hypothetical protein
MTKEELATLLSHTRLRERARRACELVLVEGKSQTEAARIVGTSKEAVSIAIKSVRKAEARLVSEQATANLSLGVGIEIPIITAYRTGEWSTEDDMPVCSQGTRICVALALGRYDLLPAPWTDPLAAYKKQLNDRQRAIVDISRSW